MIRKYTDAELKRALDMVEEGLSFSEAARANNLNKSIVAREIRKEVTFFIYFRFIFFIRHLVSLSICNDSVIFCKALL